MRKIKLILAEDYINFQFVLKEFIEPLNAFEIVGIAEDGEQLIEMISNEQPDLILADIQMPKLTGVEAINMCLKTCPHLQFIFITGFEEFAIQAFELDAVDYLVKPIDKDRLYVALERAKKRISLKQRYQQRPVLSVIVDRTSYFIPFKDIIFIEKIGRKTQIHTTAKRFETNESLDQIFRKLNDSFFKSHRSYIINLDYVSHLSYEGETNFVHFRDCQEIAYVSKLQKNELIQALTFDKYQI